MAARIYNKLVRDKIPDIITASGERCDFEILSDTRYEEELDKKLAEEVGEYLGSGSVEELADICEVLLAILVAKKVSAAEFERLRLCKAGERGAFKRRIFLKDAGG